jgi:two-component system, cell cycle sensor histidine kinase and response regulator CckA
VTRRPLTAKQPDGERAGAYRVLFERNPLPMWVYDSETLAFLEVNDAAVDQYGYARHEFLAMTILDIRPEEDRLDLAGEALRLPAADLQVWPGPWRHVRKDGSVRLVRVSSHPLSFSERPARVVVVQDVTEITRTAEQYRFFIERTAEGVWRAEVDPPIPVDAPENEQIERCTRHARLVEVNEAMTRMYGYASEAEILGTQLSSTFDLDDPRSLDFFRSFVRSGYRTVELESHELDRQGAPRWFVNNLLGVVEEGFLTAIWGTQRDVTEQRRSEEALRQSQEQLRQAQKMEAVGRLAGGVAHDFNNLLSAILSYSEMVIADLPDDHPSRDDVEQIRQAGERAAELTQQLLAFSRRQLLQLRLLNLNTVVASVDRMLRRVIGEDIELRTVLAPALGHARGDAGQLEQMLMNLAVNARDAMPSGGTLTITTANANVGEAGAARWPELQPGSYVTLSVADTGVGMTPEVRERIFEPFFTTKGPGHGTGLGLSTVYGIVAQSGGHVFVTSEPGRGSTFTVYLPVQPGDAEHPAAAPPRPPVRGGAETVLLVEDEELVRRLTCEILRRNGYRVLEAADGVDALAILRQHPDRIDLLLTDVVMPRMSGYELVEQVRPLRPDMHILYVSGYSEEAIARQGQLTEGIELLAKPFTPGVLTAKIRQLLDQTP